MYFITEDDFLEAKVNRYQNLVGKVQSDQQPDIDKELPYVPRWPMLIQTVCSIMLFTFSSFYHGVSCMDEQLMHFYRKFDLAGIAFMIMGSSTGPMYYLLFCEELNFQRNFFLGQIYFCCFAALFVAMRPGQKDFNNIAVLAKAFVGAGLSCVPGMYYTFYFVD